MDPTEKMLRHVHDMAFGHLITFLLSREIARAADPDAEAAEWKKTLVAAGGLMTFPQVPPEMSDAASQELEETLRGYVRRALALATGRPLDQEPD